MADDAAISLETLEQVYAADQKCNPNNHIGRGFDDVFEEKFKKFLK
jgi:hypothetical protein